jgi:hypothetical protein
MSRVTVVIAATESADAVRRCLESLRRSGGAEPPIFAAVADGLPGGETLSGLDAVVVRRPGVTGVPQLRKLGADAAVAAGAEWIAFTEDSVLAEPGYAAALRATGDAVAIGGSVGCDVGPRAVDWAVFFAEYASFLPPLERAGLRRLAGNNFAVRADALARFADPDAVHETFLQWRIEAAGQTCRYVDAFAVRHVRRYGVGEAVADRYRHGREFGGLRFPGAGLVRRLAAAALTPALPLLLTWRIWRELSARRRHRGAFLRTLPMTLLLQSAWALGECIGYLRKAEGGGREEEG